MGQIGSHFLHGVFQMAIVRMFIFLQGVPIAYDKLIHLKCVSNSEMFILLQGVPFSYIQGVSKLRLSRPNRV